MIPVALVTIISALISFLATPLTIKMATKFGLVDDPKKRQHPATTHVKVVPRAGGVPLLLAVLLTSLLFLGVNKIIFGVLLGSILIVIMGLADDYFDLSPYFRFFLNIVIVALVISFGLGIPFVSNPFGGVWRLDTQVLTFQFFGIHQFLIVANIFSVFWIVAMMNFVNWSKGVDGQMPGFVAIASLILGVLAYRFSAHDISTQSVAIFAFITGGAFLGFLPWNFYPQRIMPGYGGGALGGFLLGVLSILSWGKLGTLMVVLAVPLTDALYVIMRRLRNGQSPFRGDAGHFHHRLLQMGWGRRRIAIFYFIISLLMGLAALIFQGFEKVLALGIVFVSLGAFIAVANEVKKSSKLFANRPLG